MDIDGVVHEAEEAAIADVDISLTIGEVHAVVVAAEVSIFRGIRGALDTVEAEVFRILAEDA